MAGASKREEDALRQECRQRMEALVRKDQQAPRFEYLVPIPGLESLLTDPRDYPALYLILNMCLTIVPAAALMLWKGSSHWQGALYMAVSYALYLVRFLLTVHFTVHTRLFKQGYDALNWVLPCILCPLMGMPPGNYRTLHVIHHVGDNKHGVDYSSTESYQRDDIAHWLMYFFRFLVGRWLDLPMHAATHKGNGILMSTVTGETLYWLVIAACWQYNPVGTLWVFIIPVFVTTISLMLGNWCQHVFVDPDMPHDTYRSTYNCLDCFYNRLTYQDGYHILHHSNAKTHWSDVPQTFLNKLDDHDNRDAIVFHTLGPIHVGLLAFAGRLRFLADHIVPCGPKQAKRTKQEWVALMQRRLEPVRSRPAQQATNGRSDKANKSSERIQADAGTLPSA